MRNLVGRTVRIVQKPHVRGYPQFKAGTLAKVEIQPQPGGFMYVLFKRRGGGTEEALAYREEFVVPRKKAKAKR